MTQAQLLIPRLHREPALHGSCLLAPALEQNVKRGAILLIQIGGVRG